MEEQAIGMDVDANSVPVDLLQYYGKEFDDWAEASGFQQIALWRMLPESEKERFARDNVGVTMDKVLGAMSAFLAPRVSEYRDERIGDGPEYRKVPLLARLVYAGIVPDTVVETCTVKQFLDLAARISAAVTDRRQLEIPLDEFFAGAKAGIEQLRDSGATTGGVLSSMVPLASKREVVLSAIFSLPKFAGLKRSVMKSAHWISPSGHMYVCEKDPITSAPLYVKDHKMLEEEIKTTTGTAAVVLPGSFADFETVAALMCTRRPIWDLDHLRFDPLSVITVETAYAGYWALPRQAAQFRTLIEALAASSKDFPPPSNLTGHGRMAEYLHYLIVKCRENKRLSEYPTDTTIGAYYRLNLTAAFGEHMRRWVAVSEFDSYYAAVRELSAPANSLAEACKQVAARRSVENANVSFQLLANATTANGNHVEAREVNAVVKPSVLLRKLEEMGCTRPITVDYCGVDQGHAVAAMRAWNPEVKIMTYGGTRMAANKEVFTPWMIEQGYPGSAEILYDDSYGEGATDVRGKNALKVGQLEVTNYRGAIIKFYPDEAATTTWTKNTAGRTIALLPYRLHDLPKLYRHVHLYAPGRAHSPEIYAVCYGRLTTPPPEGDVARVVLELFGQLVCKTALMSLANHYRTFMYKYGHPTAFRPEIIQRGAGQPNLISQAHTMLGFGYKDIPGINDIESLVSVAKKDYLDVGSELMPDVSELASILRVTEVFAEGPPKQAHGSSPFEKPKGKKRKTNGQGMEIESPEEEEAPPGRREKEGGDVSKHTYE